MAEFVRMCLDGDPSVEGMVRANAVAAKQRRGWVIVDDASESSEKTTRKSSRKSKSTTASTANEVSTQE